MKLPVTLPEPVSMMRGGAKLYLKVFTPACAALILLIAFKYATGNPIHYFTRDPSATMEQPMYLGLFSNLGMVSWGLVSAFLWFAAFFIRKMDAGDRLRDFFFLAAITTSVLYLDDFFQLHEEVFPLYLHIPQRLVFLFYGIWISYFIWKYLRVIMLVDPLLFFASVVFFGISAGVDLVQGYVTVPEHHLFEDGSKFLGIIGWCVYFSRFSFFYITESSLRRMPGDGAAGSVQVS